MVYYRLDNLRKYLTKYVIFLIKQSPEVDNTAAVLKNTASSPFLFHHP